MKKLTSKLVKKPSTNRTKARVITTDAEIDAAIAHTNAQDKHRPRVTRAHYRISDDAIALTLDNGVEVAIPRRLLQGLEKATAAQLSRVEIEGPGSGLHWPSLDIDHYVPAILAGVFGTRQWMSELGTKGGNVRNPKKAAASRRNGRLGGRPRKQPSHNRA